MGDLFELLVPPAVGEETVELGDGRGGERGEDVAEVRDLTLFYQDTKQQSEVLALARFLDKHPSRMNYPSYQARGLPIGSGPMERFCKQLTARLKGPGLCWSTANVTPMAHLVSRWSLEPHRFLNPPHEPAKLKLAA